MTLRDKCARWQPSAQDAGLELKVDFTACSKKRNPLKTAILTAVLWRSKTKEILVSSALQGWIPPRVVQFLIKHGGFAND